MKLNDFIGDIQVDPETYDVTVNGELITSNYVETVPMAKKYFLF
jgi:urease subunit alpha